jgi:5,10-methylenetetrahydromethanopterin reductase
MVELAGEVADGALLLVGLDGRAIARARRHLRDGARRAGRSLGGFPVAFVVPLGLADTLAEARRWPQRWCAPDQPFLAYPSASNLYWLREAGLDLPGGASPASIGDALAARVCEAFGLFGPAEHCAERLLRARDEAGVEHVFLFPAHTRDGSYEMPAAEVEAVRRVIRPRVR